MSQEFDPDPSSGRRVGGRRPPEGVGAVGFVGFCEEFRYSEKNHPWMCGKQDPCYRFRDRGFFKLRIPRIHETRYELVG
jgi:hypothetical protein